MKSLAVVFSFMLFVQCKNDPAQIILDDIQKLPQEITKQDTLSKQVVDSTYKSLPLALNINTDFYNLEDLSDEFIYDIKYATEDNFLKQAVYDCPACYLRKQTAIALLKVQQDLKAQGYQIKIFDCYRPLEVQKKMWQIMPGTNYVANPQKGSKHNRGAAVDLTLVDLQGNELDMGTPFDFFGQEAHHTYTNLPEEIKNNRLLLKNTMEKHQFKSIYSEWWHYEFIPERQSEIANFKWVCE